MVRYGRHIVFGLVFVFCFALVYTSFTCRPMKYSVVFKKENLREGFGLFLQHDSLNRGYHILRL